MRRVSHGKCPKCGTEMVPMIFSSFCPKDCENPTVTVDSSSSADNEAEYIIYYCDKNMEGKIIRGIPTVHVTIDPDSFLGHKDGDNLWKARIIGEPKEQKSYYPGYRAFSNNFKIIEKYVCKG